MASAGKLTIKVIEARLERDTSWLTKMDPYVFIESRMQRIKSETMNGGGKNPSWPDEEFCIDVKYVGDDCRLAVMDENNCGSNDVVGEATIKLSAMCCDGGFDEWYAL